ncbi:hypothetical protein Bca52824_019065 [Brassica carinata]|uniref:Uncharacterized protein n=1 Tax=Brassica carinata TaxID=52824 RepID=A0A8X7VRR1_BRACI|nr:hypothetical protein Bca52824_019065 [Brassica carinata]
MNAHLRLDGSTDSSLLSTQKSETLMYINDCRFPDLCFRDEASIGGGASLEIKEKEESSSMASKVSDLRGIAGCLNPVSLMYDIHYPVSNDHNT